MASVEVVCPNEAAHTAMQNINQAHEFAIVRTLKKPGKRRPITESTEANTPTSSEQFYAMAKCPGGMPSPPRQPQLSRTRVSMFVVQKEMLLIHPRRHRHVEKSDHHLVVGLISPGNRAVGIGVMSVVAGVVVPGDCL